MGEKRNVYRLLVGKPEGKRPLGRPRRSWIYNIKMDLLEIGLSAVDWTGLKNGVFWVVTSCGSCKNRRFGGTWRLLHQGDKNR
jgi:hypothetical protein